MKKIYSTFHGLITMIAMIALVSFSQSVNAQCSLGCTSNIQISLDEDCQAEVTPSMVLNDDDTTCPGGNFIVEVRDENGNLLPNSPIVTSAYVNQTVEIKVIDQITGNSCWGNATVEDKMAPTISCEDVTIECYETGSYTPTAEDNCTAVATVTEIGGTETPLECDDEFIFEMTKTFKATDASGNESLPCTQKITVKRFNYDDVTPPVNRTMSGSNPITCTEFEAMLKDDEGNPHHTETGVPTIGNGGSINFDMYPSDGLCNVFTTYSDVVFPAVGGVTKIMRTWKFAEWHCNSSVVTEHVQFLEVVDNEGPTFTCPENMTVSTSSGLECKAMVLLPSVVLSDNCSNETRLDITYPGGFAENVGPNGLLVELPMGVNEITYTAYDEHLNSNATPCTFTVTVEDNTAPTVVCIQNTVVSLTIDGTGRIYAGSFDNGSYDDCGEVYFQAKRMDNGGNCGFDNTFSDFVEFCCADDEEVTVILRVYDSEDFSSANYNECMVQVQVQDKLDPVISCPAAVEVACDTPYDLEDLSQWGEAIAYDNCNVTVTENAPSVNINSCGEGYILRSWVATTSNSNSSVGCTQLITFKNYDPFDGDDPNQLSWPGDYTLNSCANSASTSPEVTGEPVINEDACDKVGVSYDDKYFNIINSDNACAKIIRTWTVVDCCQKDDDGKYYEWTHQQTIAIVNTQGPEFEGTYDDLSTCTYDADCNDGFIELNASASDDCTGELVWKYSIDANNDGTFDIVSPTSNGSSISASGNYPIGTHRIVYTVEDGCGNATSKEQIFTIANCKKPTPICHNGLAIDLMPMDTDNDGEADTGMIEIWASDFDKGSYHPCGYPVKVSFSADVNDTNKMFNCSNVGENSVQIWATVTLPDGTLLQDYCVASLDVQDNNNVCTDDGSTSAITVNVTGKIADEMNEAYDEVSVKLEGGEMTSMTNTDGQYAFNDMAKGGNYNVIPNKKGDYINGVTTLDLIMIQKHILGIEELASPYKVIAADANKDEKVSGSDIVALRKLILGLYENDELPNNKSWRFVDQAYQFLNASNPLGENFPELYNIYKLNADMNIDFVALKVGDVNNTAKANANSVKIESRSTKTLNLTSNNAEFNEGDVVAIDVTSENMSEVLGFQFTANFDADMFSFEGIKAGALNVTEDNFGLNRLEEGIITTSWNTNNSLDVDADDVLFSIQLRAMNNGELNGNFNVTSDVTEAVAYDQNYNAMEVSFDIRSNDVDVDATFELYQNVPNPFTSNTTISFMLPSTQNVEIAVLDVSGKMIYNINREFKKGLNNVNVDLSDLNVNGVLYYQLKADEYTATRKMVVIK